MGEKRNVYRRERERAKGKGTNRKTKTYWVNNIKMKVGEIGWGDVVWIGLAQNRDQWRALENRIMNFRVS
jgi:hypothetical protein